MADVEPAQMCKRHSSEQISRLPRAVLAASSLSTSLSGIRAHAVEHFCQKRRQSSKLRRAYVADQCARHPHGMGLELLQEIEPPLGNAHLDDAPVLLAAPPSHQAARDQLIH